MCSQISLVLTFFLQYDKIIYYAEESAKIQKKGNPDVEKDKKEQIEDTAKENVGAADKKSDAKKTGTTVQVEIIGAEKSRESEKTSDKPKKKYSLKEAFRTSNKLLILALSLALGFTVFFFSPMDIFLGNQREFVVEFKYAALPMLITSLSASAAVAGVLTLALLIREKVFGIVSRLFFGLLLAMYAQTLFFNSKMATITGDTVDYSENITPAIVNAVIYSLIILLPLILYIFANNFKKNKVLNCGKGMILPYVSGLIFVMQLVGTGSTILSTDFSKYEKMYTKYLAIEPTTSLSNEENVVVFLADRLDSLWMDEVIERFPEVSDKLKGFTFYQNNIAHNTNTFPSVPQMLTNSYYKGEEWADYTGKAWDGETLPKRLMENGFDVNLLIDNLTTYSSIAQIGEQCSNIGESDAELIEFNYLGAGGIIPTMSCLSFSKLSPYVLKTEFTRGMGSNLSQDFVQYLDDMPDRMPMTVGVESDMAYYKYLTKNGLTADNENKTFSFIHLNCSHGANNATAALNPDFFRADTADIYDTTRGGFEIIFNYISEMKRLGIYDNSTIIILGDHGRAPVEIEVDDKPGLTSAITTAVLIKPKNAPREKLALDRDSELSNDFFAASVLEYAGLDHSDFGISYNDVINGGLHPDRWLQTFDWHGYGDVVYKAYYKVTGDARDFSNWEEQPNHE